MAQAKKSISYHELHDELESILLKLQQDTIDIDEALKLFERGQKVVTELQTYLQTAENKITELQAPAT